MTKLMNNSEDLRPDKTGPNERRVEQNFSREPRFETNTCPGAAEALTRTFQELRDRSRTGRGGVVSWQAPRNKLSDAAPPAALGPHLYDGIAGVAVFLGAYFSVTADAEVRDLALRSIAPLRANVAELAAAPERARGPAVAIGGLVGLGAFLYTFVRLAAWLREPELLESASLAAQVITPDSIGADDRLDVMSGCAGALLALLAFHGEASVREADRARALDLALLCGRNLLNRRASYRSGPGAWAKSECPPLSGFAHGAAGIAHALVRLFETTGRQEFRDAALEGFAFERSLYDPAARTWFDPCFNRAVQQSAWCQGAPGMALARLASLASAGTPAVREDLEECLDITLAQPESERDHLCCGNFGQVEILYAAGRALDRPRLIAGARDLARRVLARAGDFRFEPVDGQPQFHPSLFLGSAGVGYALLRLIHPDSLPCLLLLH